MIFRFINWLKSQYVKYKKKKEIEKKIKLLKKRDPFIYKH
jgi:hypothetical protein